MTPRHDARAVLRLTEQRRRAEARLAEIDANLRPHARRLCDAAGFPVLLTGPALERLAIERAGRAA